MPVRNPDTPQERLKLLYDISGLTWREIALLTALQDIPPGTLCSVANGAKVPKKYQRQLGDDVEVTVVSMNGVVIPPRTQVHHADECVECGRAYVSNHPRRQRCFVCSPFRGKRAERVPKR